MDEEQQQKKENYQADPAEVAEWVRVISLPKEHEEYVKPVHFR